MPDPVPEPLESPNAADTMVPVVDDSATMRALVGHALRGGGVPVLECPPGDQALKVASESPDRVDAIVLDVNLPGKDGYEILRILQANPSTATIPVLLLTASATGADDVVRSIQGGAADHLTKP